MKSDLKTNTISIIANIYLDDLEMAIERLNNKQIELGDPKLNEYMQNYFSQKFSIKIKNQIIPISLQEFTPVENIISIKLVATKTSSLKNATISNQILTEIFDDQKNTVRIEENENTVELNYDKSKPIQKVSFNNAKK
ncbi:MAG: hypothetical protein IPO27_00150 [Bacteroidetes bacterium]|nr:hypothetical protein [Bacteroidota bacterium]